MAWFLFGNLDWFSRIQSLATWEFVFIKRNIGSEVGDSSPDAPDLPDLGSAGRISD
jgi:hypothetical protein